MIDEEKELAPVRAAGERLARLEERILGALGQKDAQMLMEHARAGDDRILASFGDRLNEFRGETREGFRHSERETQASIYKAVTESENRIMGKIELLAGSVAAVSAAIAAPSSDARRLHPALPWTLGPGAGASILYLILVAVGVLPRPGG